MRDTGADEPRRYASCCCGPSSPSSIGCGLPPAQVMNFEPTVSLSLTKNEPSCACTSTLTSKLVPPLNSNLISPGSRARHELHDRSVLRGAVVGEEEGVAVHVEDVDHLVLVARVEGLHHRAAGARGLDLDLARGAAVVVLLGAGAFPAPHHGLEERERRRGSRRRPDRATPSARRWRRRRQRQRRRRGAETHSARTRESCSSRSPFDLDRASGRTLPPAGRGRQPILGD